MSARTVFVGAATVLGVGAVLVLNPADAKSRGEGPSSVEQSSVTVRHQSTSFLSSPLRMAATPSLVVAMTTGLSMTTTRAKAAAMTMATTRGRVMTDVHP